MGDSALTAAASVSFAEELEAESSAFYEKLAERFDEGKEPFLGFARESEKNKTHLVRTYRETISDALEATSSLGSLELPDYDFQAALAADTSFEEVLEMALELEEGASETYAQIAKQGQALLATIALAFSAVAKKRRARKGVLQTMLDEARRAT